MNILYKNDIKRSRQLLPGREHDTPKCSGLGHIHRNHLRKFSAMKISEGLWCGVFYRGQVVGIACARSRRHGVSMSRKGGLLGDIVGSCARLVGLMLSSPIYFTKRTKDMTGDKEQR